MGRVRRPGEEVKKDKREGAAVGVVNACRHALRFTLPAGIVQEGRTRRSAASRPRESLEQGFVKTSVFEEGRPGSALERLRFPSKLVFLFLFTYRYLHVIADEWHKLHGAARLRGFAPKTNMHTYRTFGNMLGMVFVHSFDRSVRVYEAMILRGFSGRFQSVTAFRATSRDAVFAVAAFACMVCLVAFDLYLEFPRG